ncbi:hypothetical protein EFA69_17075 [Rufibacter immobilis]|uniref:Uncharacterized protein n=1 Tax=Rufibacter immobilis TaxID=1348778 RepID=A0A3M9MRI9_9BACT|nr:hypothetical protein [Rufibacter immobilis]RNI27815.1 hypothetical protein EFA69_17075 [Rufibacter immobilis]
MSLLFISQSHRQTATSLQKEGVPAQQLPSTIQLARETAESWLHQEIEQGNLPLVIQLVNGKFPESSAQLLLEELKDLLVAKFIVRLKFNYALARNAASIVLPFVMQRLVDHLQQNPQFKTWWDALDLRKHLPSKADLKSKIRSVGQSLSGNASASESAFA